MGQNASHLKIMYGKRFIIIVVIVALLLAVPFTAMQFTPEVNWTLFDFLVAGLLLLLTGLLCEVVIRKSASRRRKILLCLVILIIFMLVWAELAVGIFGTPLAGT